MEINKVLLRNAARAWGIQPSYIIESKNLVVWAPVTTLLRVLQDLTKVPIKGDADLQKILRMRREKYWMDVLPASLVFWNGQPRDFEIYLSLAMSTLPLTMTLTDEQGNTHPARFETVGQRKFEDHHRLKIRLSHTLPQGYHTLKLQIDDRELSCLLICPPERLDSCQDLTHSWGPFLPLYALRTDSDWGVGSLKELHQAGQLCHSYGARWIGTLPLLAVNLEPIECDPSPYSALTRLFWNELFLDVDALVAKYDHRQGRKLIDSPEFQHELREVRASKYVDYYRVYLLKKRVLKMISRDFFAQGSHHSTDYKAFVAENPEIDSYARFRSGDPEEQNFHRFVQFEMNTALRELAETSPFGLYLDFPVGVNDAGYDFLAFNSVFFKEVSVGAPPEEVFQQGQDWGFPSFNPFTHRAEGYDYFRKSLRNHLKFCKILRMDHVMGLYRVYCVPKGFSGLDGVYLRYPPEDLFAIAILEAHRAQADIVGENLGTVPAAVEKLLRTRNLNGMWVLQMETSRNPDDAFNSIPDNAMVSFNTHDMPMWAQYQKGTDLAQVRDLKILNASSYNNFLSERMRSLKKWDQLVDGKNITVRLHEDLAKTRAKYFVVTMEDLWNEEEPQNIPGTWKEYPNWRRKFKEKISEWPHHKQGHNILEILKKERGPHLR